MKNKKNVECKKQSICTKTNKNTTLTPSPSPSERVASAFTLAEVLITLVIIGVIAAITVPTMIAKYHEEETVSRVKKTYSIVTQAWNKYQSDYSCMGKVSKCFSSSDSIGNMDFYNRFIKYFNYVKVVPVYTDTSSYSWLPDKAYNINGSEVSSPWFAVHKGPLSDSVLITLSDGTIIHAQLPDNMKHSGFIFIDTNGKKKPNRVGKDQFPIGIGAYNNDKYAAKVHPFYNEDSSTLNYAGLCNIRDNHECDVDTCTRENCSPTAYVLKYNKLPPITW